MICIGVAAEAFWEGAAGTDLALTSTTADGCDPYVINTRMTSYAEYTANQVAQYTNAARNQAFVLAGGVWIYATFPYIKIYPAITSEGGFVCSTNFPPLFEFKAQMSDSEYDNMDGPEHPYGGYLVRAGAVFAEGFSGNNPNKQGGNAIPLGSLFGF